MAKKPYQHKAPTSDRAKQRACLCCRSIFLSTGPANRMCDGCRGGDVSPFSPDGIPDGYAFLTETPTT